MQANNDLQKMKKIILCISIGFLVVIIFSLIKLIHINPYGAGVGISNLDSFVPNLSQMNKDRIYNIIYQVCVEQENCNPSNNDAIVRENSVKTTSSENGKKTINNTSFIIDIPSAEQSFKVSFSWGDDELDNDLENYDISCPSEKERIYESKCFIERDDAPNLTIQHDYLLKITSNTQLSNYIYNTVFSYIDSKKEYLTGVSKNPSVTLTIDEASFIDYFDDDDYIYSVSAETDDGRAYTINIRIQSSEEQPGVAILIDREDIDNHSHAVIYSIDNQNLLNRLKNWLIKISKNEDLQINTTTIDGFNDPHDNEEDYWL